jgi:hypothetical protein
LYISENVIKVRKSWWLRWMGYVVNMEKMRNTLKSGWEIREERNHLGDIGRMGG